MNFELTRKKVLENYKNVIKVGYCGLQNLLNYSDRLGYTTGVNGWNADIYVVNCDTVIVTGYRPFGNIDASYELCKKYDEKAMKLIQSNTSALPKQLEELLQEFAVEVLKKEE